MSESDRSAAARSREPDPEVSVIIPTRNRRALLQKALASALAQQDISLEVIVVDDSSTDETPHYLTSIEDDRVCALRQETHEGVSAARNRGIEAARGQWIAFLDDDDLWLPERLRTLVDTANAAGADFAYNDVRVIDVDGRYLELLKAPPPNDLASALCRSGTITGPSAVIANRELVRRTGGFDPELAYLADWDLWLRFAAAGRAARCAQPLTEYRQHLGSMLMDRNLDIYAEITRLFGRHPQIDVEPLRLTRWVIRRYREEGRRLRASRLYLHEARQHRAPSSLLRAGVVLLGERPMRLLKRVRQSLLRKHLLPGRSFRRRPPKWLNESRSSRS
jgi:glycosyltransferase involved in cell wall biosynthesis